MVLIRAYVSQLEVFRRLPVMTAFVDRLARHGRVDLLRPPGHGAVRSAARLSAPDDGGAHRRPPRRARRRRQRAGDDRRARGRRSARLPVRGYASGAGGRAGALQHRPAGRLGSRLPVGHPARRVRAASCEAMDTGWGTPTTREADAPVRFAVTPIEAMADWHRDVHACVGRARATQWPPSGCSTNPTSGRSSTTIRVPTLVLSRTGEAADEGAAFARLIPGAIAPGDAGNGAVRHHGARRRVPRGDRLVREPGARRRGGARERARDRVVHGHRRVDRAAGGARRRRAGASSSSEHHGASAGASPATAAASSTPQATASSRVRRACPRDPLRAGDRRGRRAASGSSCAPGCTPANAGRSTGRSEASPSRSAPA